MAEEEETYNYVFEDIALMVAKIHEADEPNDLENVDGQEWNTADDYTAESNYSIQQNPTGLSGIARVLAEQDAREQEDALRAFEENSRLVTEPVLGLDLMVVRPFDGITYLTNWKVVIDEDGNLSLYKTPSLC